MEDLVGKRIGNYEVIRLIGSGGMANVYLASNTNLNRYAALKIVKKDAFSEAEYETIRLRFLAECQNLAQLNHPNIVKIYDAGDYESSPYLIMELLDGNTLRILTGAQMSAPTAASLLLPIADALAYMHSKGLIHRDVKPSNIILKADGTPVLTDFGISRSIEKDPNKPAITQAGYMIGTPDYISPEQALGGNLDGRSDEYSLAVILYEMVTGAKLYQGDTPNSIANKHINAPIPSAKSINPNLTDYEEAVLEKALAKNPDNRYPTMKEFESALQSIMDEADTVSKTKYADKDNSVTFPTREFVAATEKPGIAKAILIPLLVALAIICIFGIRMLIGQNQGSQLSTASVDSQAAEIVFAAESTSVINNVPSEEIPNPTSINGQIQEQIVSDETGSSSADAETASQLEETLGKNANQETAEPAVSDDTIQVGNCKYGTRLALGDKAEVINVGRLLMYEVPDDALIEGIYAFSEREFTIIDGPICMDESIWWKIDFLGYIGWSREMNSEGVYYMEKR